MKLDARAEPQLHQPTEAVGTMQVSLKEHLISELGKDSTVSLMWFATEGCGSGNLVYFLNADRLPHLIQGST
jgi:hypothetical protein